MNGSGHGFHPFGSLAGGRPWCPNVLEVLFLNEDAIKVVGGMK